MITSRYQYTVKLPNSDFKRRETLSVVSVGDESERPEP